jgi:hypothetical protein
MARTKYRKAIHTKQLSTHHGTKGYKVTRSAENGLMSAVYSSKSFDAKKGAVLMPLTDADNGWVFDAFGRNPYKQLRPEYREIVERQDGKGLGFQNTDGENGLQKQLFCLPQSYRGIEIDCLPTFFNEFYGKGPQSDLVVDGYPVDVKGIAKVATSSSWGKAHSKRKALAYFDNKRIDLGVGLSALFLMRQFQLGLPTFVCLVNDDGGFLVDLTLLYWHTTPKSTFGGRQDEYAEQVITFLQGNGQDLLRDGHGMRNGFVYAPTSYPVKGTERRAHDLGVNIQSPDGTKRRTIRLRIDTEKIEKVRLSRRGTTNKGLASISRCISEWMSTDELATALNSGLVLSMAKQSQKLLPKLMKRK